MFLRQPSCADDQVVCWSCEESVHQSALVCPYCRADMQRHAAQNALHAPKVALVMKRTPSSTAEASSERARGQPEEVAEGGPLTYLVALFALLLGSSLVLLALLIFCFSKDGSFSISWPERSWASFFGLGLTFFGVGAFFFQMLSNSEE